MKKALFMIMLITAGVIICSCGKKNNDTVSNTDNNSSGLSIATHNASGTVSFKAGGVNYSCSIAKVILSAVSLTIQSTTADIATNGSVFITCYYSTTSVTTGTYSSANSKAISAVTFMDKGTHPYSATATASGSTCTVNLTELTATSIKGTFTATAVPPLSGASVIITDGVINCTITSK